MGAGALGDHPQILDLVRQIIEAIYPVAAAQGVPLGHAASHFNFFL